MNLEEIRSRLAEFARERNWDQYHTPKNLSMALAAEAAELLEIFQWLPDEQSKDIVHNEKEMVQIRQEIADVMIYLLRLADKLGVDIEKAVLDKIKLNEKKYPIDLAKDNAVKYNKRETERLAYSSGIVVGIDVGGPRKGFHAVALRDGKYLAKFISLEAVDVKNWCQSVDASIVGIDAPCHWRSVVGARSAERQMAEEKISCYSTPTFEKAQCSSFYTWMLNGAELYRALESDYPLFNGDITAKNLFCFETFPQAVACALAGRIVSAKEKTSLRLNLVRMTGVDIAELTNIDLIDAALCAVTAHYMAIGKIRSYGDVTDGFIVVPAEPIVKADHGDRFRF